MKQRLFFGTYMDPGQRLLLNVKRMYLLGSKVQKSKFESIKHTSIYWTAVIT